MKGQVAALMKSKNCKREVRGAGVTKEVRGYCWAAVEGMDFLGECASSGCNAGGHVGKGVGAIGGEWNRGFFQKWEGPGQRKCQRQPHQQGTYYTDACCHHTATAAERAAAPSSGMSIIGMQPLPFDTHINDDDLLNLLRK